MIMLNECEQLWASRAAQALDARLTNHVVAPSVNPALDYAYTVKMYIARRLMESPENRTLVSAIYNFLTGTTFSWPFNPRVCGALIIIRKGAVGNLNC